MARVYHPQTEQLTPDHLFVDGATIHIKARLANGCLVDVTIDAQGIVAEIGGKASKNKTGRATEGGGLLKARRAK